jgi:tRNA dimethylallyltransferase
MVDEVRGLLAEGITAERLKKLGLEYREIGAYLAGQKTYRSMSRDLETEIGKFAKRQETWFRGMPRRGLPVETIESGDVESALQAVEGW